MKVPQAIHYWFGYHKLHSKKNTFRAYHPQSLNSDSILGTRVAILSGRNPLFPTR